MSLRPAYVPWFLGLGHVLHSPFGGGCRVLHSPQGFIFSKRCSPNQVCVCGGVGIASTVSLHCFLISSGGRRTHSVSALLLVSLGDVAPSVSALLLVSLGDVAPTVSLHCFLFQFLLLHTKKIRLIISWSSHFLVYIDIVIFVGQTISVRNHQLALPFSGQIRGWDLQSQRIHISTTDGKRLGLTRDRRTQRSIHL